MFVCIYDIEYGMYDYLSTTPPSISVMRSWRKNEAKLDFEETLTRVHLTTIAARVAHGDVKIRACQPLTSI